MRPLDVLLAHFAPHARPSGPDARTRAALLVYIEDRLVRIAPVTSAVETQRGWWPALIALATTWHADEREAFRQRIMLSTGAPEANGYVAALMKALFRASDCEAYVRAGLAAVDPKHRANATQLAYYFGDDGGAAGASASR